MTKHYSQEHQEIHMEEMDIGDLATTRPRIVSASEIEHFAAVTGEPLPGFLSQQWAQEKGLKDRVVPGYLILSLAAGLRYQSGLTSHVIAFMGMDKVRLTTPVHPGDAIRVQVELLSKKPTKSPDRVICNYRWEILNQNDKTVAEGENICMFQLAEAGV